MVFLDSLQGGQSTDTTALINKLHQWSDQAFYHLGLITSYKAGVGAQLLSQQGFGTLGNVSPGHQEGDTQPPVHNTKRGDGLQPSAYYARQLIIDRFGVKDIGGYENRNIHGTNTKSDHALGLALDVMVYYNKALGQRVADYFAANYTELKVKYIIWYDQIFTTTGSRALYWRHYTPPGGGTGRTLQHEDHVHISFFP